jgi:hypothetical protein
MSSNQISWAELAALGEESRQKYEQKAKEIAAKAPVSTWSNCKCSKSHKTAETFFKCAIGKRYRHNGENAHLDRPYIDGSGNWAVIRERYSGDYYGSEQNGRRNNLGHMEVFIQLFETYEEASKEFNANKSYNYDKYRLPQVIKVAL